MKRDIACKECAPKYHDYPASLDGPEETVKKVHGIAIQDYHCDRCNKKILQGSKCVAISVIVEGQHYYKWEHGFIQIEKMEMVKP